MKNIKISDIAAGLLIVLFIYAAASKLSWYDHFRDQVGAFPLIKHYYKIIPWAIPALEILISVLLVFEQTRKIGLYSGGILLTIFTVYIGVMLVTVGKSLPCSCGGIISKLSWKQHFIFNLSFILLSVLGLYGEKLQIGKRSQPSNINKHIAQ